VVVLYNTRFCIWAVMVRGITILPRLITELLLGTYVFFLEIPTIIHLTIPVLLVSPRRQCDRLLG
jgi:hypothetical protein